MVECNGCVSELVVKAGTVGATLAAAIKKALQTSAIVKVKVDGTTATITFDDVSKEQFNALALAFDKATVAARESLAAAGFVDCPSCENQPKAEELPANCGTFAMGADVLTFRGCRTLPLDARTSLQVRNQHFIL